MNTSPQSKMFAWVVAHEEACVSQQEEEVSRNFHMETTLIPALPISEWVSPDLGANDSGWA